MSLVLSLLNCLPWSSWLGDGVISTTWNSWLSFKWEVHLYCVKRMFIDAAGNSKVDLPKIKWSPLWIHSYSNLPMLDVPSKTLKFQTADFFHFDSESEGIGYLLKNYVYCKQIHSVFRQPIHEKSLLHIQRYHQSKS